MKNKRRPPVKYIKTNTLQRRCSSCGLTALDEGNRQRVLDCCEHARVRAAAVWFFFVIIVSSYYVLLMTGGLWWLLPGGNICLLWPRPTSSDFWPPAAVFHLPGLEFVYHSQRALVGCWTHTGVGVNLTVLEKTLWQFSLAAATSNSLPAFFFFPIFFFSSTFCFKVKVLIKVSKIFAFANSSF